MSNLNDQQDWPMAIDNNYRLLEPSAPIYPRCWCCNTVAFKKCSMCETQLCLEHESRVAIEKEWCVTYPEKTYYSTLVLCSECAEKETSQRRFRSMSTVFALILFIILIIIIILTPTA